MTALSIVTACGDDGATVDSAGTETETETDPGDDDDDDDDSVTVTVTDPDSSSDGGDTSSSTSPTEPDSSSTDATAESSSSTGPIELCGNGVLDDGEVCDAAELGDATCETQGHLGGDLACLDDCSGFDETGCFEMECGDGMATGDEECDDADLGRQTCMSLDFDAGDLACSDSCTFDTSNCVLFSCGDGAINDPREECDIDDFGAFDSCGALGLGAGSIVCTEQCTILTDGCCGTNSVGGAETCDGTDLNGATCVGLGQGFDGGTLACNADCGGYDTSSCTDCGNAVIEAGEQCEGDDLGGNDCASVGFVGGALACDATCGFDTSGCNMCGNDAIDAGEECDGTALGTETCVSLGNTGGTIACAGTCDYDASGCTNFPLPEAGEVVITEIMQNPLAVDDTLGEYFEIHNPSLVDSFQLSGCTVEDNGVDGFTIDTDLVIDAGEYLTFARTATPGFAPDFVYSGFLLGNTDDEIRIVCNGVTVDEVIYDGGPEFPDPDGASMQLDSGFLNTTDNDLGENWCESFADLGNGDLGTPGSANVSCAAPTYPVDFCRLQFPLSIDELEGTPVDVYGRLYIAGLTDQTATNDPAANVTGFVGYGPDGSDPAVDATWTWIAAAPNPAWADPGFPGSNEDEYLATLPAPSAGTYDYAFRFTGDGGATFTYCDSDGTGGGDPYEIANAGDMVTNPNGDPALMYFSEYIEGVGDNKAVEIWNPGPLTVFLGQCQVRVYSNGAALPSASINLTATNLAANATWVLCNNLPPAPELAAACDQNSGSINFNGDDAVELFCDGAPVDVIGQIGFDPGDEWLVNGVGTQNEVLRRDCAVTAGDPDGSNAFDPSLEWDTFIQTDFTGFGTRGCP